MFYCFRCVFLRFSQPTFGWLLSPCSNFPFQWLLRGSCFLKHLKKLTWWDPKFFQISKTTRHVSFAFHKVVISSRPPRSLSLVAVFSDLKLSAKADSTEILIECMEFYTLLAVVLEVSGVHSQKRHQPL